MGQAIVIHGVTVDSPRNDNDLIMSNSQNLDTLPAENKIGAVKGIWPCPCQFRRIDASDLVMVILDMILEVIHLNGKIPLHLNHLTRFHSQYKPQISVLEYAQRLAKIATLSPSILISMACLVDRLCLIYPALTGNGLTVH